jgi:DNA gyrase subunit B
MAPKKTGSSYTADDIDVLSAIDGIRKRPSMYLGDPGTYGYHHALKEVFDNGVDEYLDGHAKTITVKVDTKTQVVEVRDDGRGIPVSKHKGEGISTLTVVFTLTHAGGKFGGAYRSATSGLHGIGVTATNACSEWLEVWTARKGKTYHQKFERGIPKTKVKVSKKKLKKGTLVRFKPDYDVFRKNTKWNVKRISEWLKDESYLCPGLKIVLKVDEADPQIFKTKNGVVDFLEEEAKKLDPLHKPIVVRNNDFDLALVWTKDGDGEKWRSFVNSSHTPQHGTHVDGVKQAIQAAFKTIATKEKGLKGDDLRDGLVAIINARVKDPQFKGQTKVKLNNAETKTVVYKGCRKALKKFAATNEPIVKQLVSRAARLRDARQQFKAEKKAIREVSVTKGARGILPGKLCSAPECPSNIRELFIVEGDSASGTVKKARVRVPTKGGSSAIHFQEVLPIRGKSINVAKQKDLDKILNNAEVKSIIQAIGTGIGDKFNLKKCRYRRIHLLGDADPDGLHIVALLLTFFSMHMPELIKEGMIGVVLNPLFMGVSASKRVYGPTVESVKKKLGKTSNIRVTRFKGLGESDADDLRVYAMDPNTRKVMKVDWLGKKDEKWVPRYMGNDVSVRKKLLDLRE